MSILKFKRMNELIWGIILLIIGLIITTFGGFKANDGWNKLKNKTEDKNEKSSYDVKSENQQGGVTAGRIDNVNIISDSKSDIEQIKKDAQTALIYQTEIVHFYSKFKTCLHWSLPLDDKTDKEIDKIFNYGRDFSNGIDFNSISKELLTRIFMDYEFREIMPNYSGADNFRPTGYNNLLGILKYFDSQIEKHLDKYGSTISTDLSTRIEYMARTTQSTISSLRIDLQTSKTTTKQTAENVADLLMLMRNDYLLMKKNYTKDISGGYPIAVGTVTKSDDKDGQIVVETQFSNY